MSRKVLLAVLAATAMTFSASVAVVAHAQAPAAAPPADALTDPSLKGPEVIKFIGVKPGDKITDLLAGKFVTSFSQAVGPKGKVFAVFPSEVVKGEKSGPKGLEEMNALAAAHPNVTVNSSSLAALGFPPNSLDEAFIRQNYHDLYDPFLGPVDVPAFNKEIYAALKPGGVFVILDHSAPAGSGLGSTNTTHRIDEERVKADMKAAGFVLDGESKIFANPEDDRLKMVYNPAVRGKTDQFLLKFKKPK